MKTIHRFRGAHALIDLQVYWGLEERAIPSFMNRRERAWLGHTLRHGDLVPLVIEGRIIGKRSPRGSRAGMLDERRQPLRSGPESRALDRKL